jgi:hypothetical protein
MQVGPWHAYNEWFSKVPIASVTPLGSNQASVAVYYPPGTLQLNNYNGNNFPQGVAANNPNNPTNNFYPNLPQSNVMSYDYNHQQTYAYANPNGLSNVVT